MRIKKLVNGIKGWRRNSRGKKPKGARGSTMWRRTLAYVRTATIASGFIITLQRCSLQFSQLLYLINTKGQFKGAKPDLRCIPDLCKPQTNSTTRKRAFRKRTELFAKSRHRHKHLREITMINYGGAWMQYANVTVNILKARNGLWLFDSKNGKFSNDVRATPVSRETTHENPVSDEYNCTKPWVYQIPTQQPVMIGTMPNYNKDRIFPSASAFFGDNATTGSTAKRKLSDLTENPVTKNEYMTLHLKYWTDSSISQIW